MKLASFARVAHLVGERERLLRCLDHEISISFKAEPWDQVVDRAMIEAVIPAIKPAINAELQRRIDIVETEMLELGMSIG
jgi:hypothetical protein